MGYFLMLASRLSLGREDGISLITISGFAFKIALEMVRMRSLAENAWF